MVRSFRPIGPVAVAGFFALLTTAEGAAFQPPGGSTTVEAVTAIGLAPAPDVGPGATRYTLEDLAREAEAAQAAFKDAYDSATKCGARNLRSTRFRRPIDWIDPKLGGYKAVIGAYYATERDHYAELLVVLDQAVAATEAAVELRAAALTGDATQEQLVAAELARQAAVQAFADKRDEAERAHQASLIAQVVAPENADLRPGTIRMLVLDEIEQREESDGKPVPPLVYQDLGLTNMAVHQLGEDEGARLRVTGSIHNTRRRRAAVPPLWLEVMDAYGSTLKTESIEPQRRARIPAGQSVAFAYEIAPMPRHASQVIVTFGPYHNMSMQLDPNHFCRLPVG